MPRVGFEFTTPVPERAKTVHALDSAAGHWDRRGTTSGADNAILSRDGVATNGVLHG
jgi:hypothetical protein